MRVVLSGAALALLVVLNGCQCPPTIVNAGGDGGTGGDVGGGGGDTGGGTGGTGGDVGGGSGGDVGGGVGGSAGGGLGGGLGGGAGGGTGGTGGNLATDGGCGLVTCASAGATCGLIGDGCGLLLDCGSCTAPATCGGGGVANACGGNSGCVKRTCAGIGATCGPMSDGCGGLLNCGSCALPETCGGGGIASVCGQSGTNVTTDGGVQGTTCASANAQCGIIGDGLGGILNCGGCDAGLCGGGGVPYHCGGGNVCTRLTCATAGATCGAVGDGCGGILSCGSCAAPMTCGGGGQANQCGGGVFCTPRTCAQAGATCGAVGDGCGGLIDGGCGTCATGSCGASGVPNQCGTGGGACVAKTVAQLDAGCGLIGDGCGGLLDAGTCTTGTCGGGGQPNQCGAPPPCVPKTCAQLNKNCGAVGDGCGGLIAGGCGTCTAPDICGGAGIPSVCGSVIPDGGSACVNLCTKQAQCTTGTTTLVGTVYAPTDPSLGYGSPDPIPNALVYVPNAPLDPLTLPDGGTPDGGVEVSCDQCSAGVSGSPLVTTYSAVDGTFTLSNVPCGVGVNVPVVIQLGKWRRQVTLPNLTCCAQNSMTADQSRLPRRQFEGSLNDNIPLIAVVTGNADGIENVLPKLGIDQVVGDGQYTIPSGKGRVRFYVDNGFNNSTLLTGGGTIPPASQLYGNLNELLKYDMIIIDCVGQENLRTTTERANLEAYANRGGRVFASHFAYVWLFGFANVGGNCTSSSISFTGTATWAHTTCGMTVADPPNQDAYIDISFGKGITFAQWVQVVGAQATTSTPLVPRIRVNTVRHDFDAVIAPAQRWVFGYPTLTCTAATCNTLGYSCGGSVANGCGGTMRCRSGSTNTQGTCSTGTCGGGGTPGVCGTGSTCVPKTCAQFGFTCGLFGDGCGGTLNCGSCAVGSSCGLTAVGQCGSAPVIPLQYTFNTPVSAQPTNQCGRVLFSDFHVANGGYFSGQAAAPLTPQEKVFEYLIFDLSSCIAPDVAGAADLHPEDLRAAGPELWRGRRRLRQRHRLVRHLRLSAELRRRRHARASAVRPARR